MQNELVNTFNVLRTLKKEFTNSFPSYPRQENITEAFKKNKLPYKSILVDRAYELAHFEWKQNPKR